MNACAETAVLFSAVLRPHRSSSASGIRIVAVLLSIVWLVFGLVFVIAGAWPVFAYLGLEFLLVMFALRLNLKHGSEFEAISLTPRALTVRRVDHWGKERSQSFPPQWLQVNVESRDGIDAHIELRSHGRSLLIAQFLQPSERIEFAATLRRELSRLSVNAAAFA